jgi:tRNA(Ile)-lysidine synthase
MPDLPTRVLTLIRHAKLIRPHDYVLVGVSGGVDSMALLSVLHTLQDTIPFDVAVAHVNHMLRGQESDGDEDFVRAAAEGFSLPAHVKRVDIHGLAKSSGKSIQHAARDVRYDYFSELARTYGYQRIAIAHNQDDQVETFLLRVVKGTGIRGLSCIPVSRGPIIRPLLDVTRREIEQYVTEKGIRYREDSSNRKDAYERNYVRHRILPPMERLNPTVRSRIMSLLGDLTRLNERLDREARSLLTTWLPGDGEITLPVGQLIACSEETRFRILSEVLGRLAPGFIALREHIRLVEKVLQSSRPSASALLPFRIIVLREYDKLVFTAATAPPQVVETFPLRPGHTVVEALGISVDIDLVDHPPSEFSSDRYSAFLDPGSVSRLSVRTFREGDRFVPLGMAHAVKLKDYFISRKLPRTHRRRIPLLLIGDCIAWIIGERIDDRFKITAQTTKVVGVTVRKLSTISE